MIEVDGNKIEGGGQIVRLTLGFSALYNKPVHLKNVLQGRAKEGLGHQHLNGLRLVKQLSEADVEGDEIGSTCITFKPKKIKSGKYYVDAKTAGSITLLLQVSLPCTLFGKEQTELTLRGGTNVPMAPQIDYTIQVFRPLLEKFGATFDCKILKRGFYPAGQGHIEVRINPVKELKPVNLLEFGEVESITGEAFVSGVLPFSMAEQMAAAAENILKKSIKADITIKSKKFNKDEAHGNGSGINLVAVTTTGCYIGGSALGDRGTKSFVVGEKAAKELLDSIEIKACVDQYAQDQLIIFMSLANGKSSIKTGCITHHTEKAIQVAEMLTNVKFEIEKLDNHCHIITCNGLGKL